MIWKVRKRDRPSEKFKRRISSTLAFPGGEDWRAYAVFMNKHQLMSYQGHAGMQTHACIHTHTNTHTCMHARMHKHTHVCTHACTNTHTHTHSTGLIPNRIVSTLQANMGCQHKCRKAGPDGKGELSSMEAEPSSVSGRCCMVTVTIQCVGLHPKWIHDLLVVKGRTNRFEDVQTAFGLWYTYVLQTSEEATTYLLGPYAIPSPVGGVHGVASLVGVSQRVWLGSHCCEHTPDTLPDPISVLPSNALCIVHVCIS